jgi:hypothetical protein
MVTLNGDRLIQLPVEDSKANYLAGFCRFRLSCSWRWAFSANTPNGEPGWDLEEGI